MLWTDPPWRVRGDRRRWGWARLVSKRWGGWGHEPHPFRPPSAHLSCAEFPPPPARSWTWSPSCARIRSTLLSLKIKLLSDFFKIACQFTPKSLVLETLCNNIKNRSLSILKCWSIMQITQLNIYMNDSMRVFITSSCS